MPNATERAETPPSGEALSRRSPCDLFWEVHVPSLLERSRDTTIASLDGTAHFRIEGPAGGDWLLCACRGVIELVERGTPRDPTVTITLSDADFVGIAAGDLDHREAFFQGRVQIDGDVELALRASNLIPILRERFPFHLDEQQ